MVHITVAAAAAAAKSLQSCLTLCDPIDSSPPGSPVPGILQARTPEWVAISFSNAWNWKVKVKSLSRVRLLATHGLQPTRLLRPWDSPGKSHITTSTQKSMCFSNWTILDLVLFESKLFHPYKLLLCSLICICLSSTPFVCGPWSSEQFSVFHEALVLICMELNCAQSHSICHNALLTVATQ